MPDNKFMEEEKIIEAQVEEVVSQPEQPQEVKVEVSQEEIKQVQDEINAVLEKHNVTIEVIPAYNLMIKPRK